MLRTGRGGWFQDEMGELLVKFLIGGLAVSIFAVIGDVIEPKSLGGVFAAAPSVALATLGLSLLAHGRVYTSVEGRSMIVGGIALVGYLFCVTRLLTCFPKAHSLLVASMALVIWLGLAFGLWSVFIRGPA